MIKDYITYIKESREFNKNGELTVNNITFDIELAETFEEQEKGLMFRKHMDENKGMLFVYDEDNFYSFWMKNTYIPLDIIYINKDKEIVDIKENAKPHSLKSLKPYDKCRYILEINGGLSDKYGIKIGDKVNFYI